MNNINEENLCKKIRVINHNHENYKSIPENMICIYLVKKKASI